MMTPRIIIIVLIVCFTGFFIFKTAIPEAPSPVTKGDGNLPLAGLPGPKPEKNPDKKNAPGKDPMQAAMGHPPEKISAIPPINHDREVYSSDQADREPDYFNNLISLEHPSRERETGPSHPLKVAFERTFDVNMSLERRLFRERMRAQTDPELIQSLKDLGLEDHLIQNHMALRHRAWLNTMNARPDDSETP